MLLVLAWVLRAIGAAANNSKATRKSHLEAGFGVDMAGIYHKLCLIGYVACRVRSIGVLGQHSEDEKKKLSAFSLGVG